MSVSHVLRFLCDCIHELYVSVFQDSGGSCSPLQDSASEVQEEEVLYKIFQVTIPYWFNGNIGKHSA